MNGSRTLQDAVKFAVELDKILAEEMLEDEGFSVFDKDDIKVYKKTSKLNRDSWTESSLRNAYKSLMKYEGIFIEYGFDLREIVLPKDIIDSKVLKSKIVNGEIIPEKGEEDIWGALKNKKIETYDDIIQIKKIMDKGYSFEDEFIYQINLILNSEAFYFNNISNEFPLKKVKRKPISFQLNSILFSWFNKKMLLADEMGLGKTFQSLAIVAEEESFPLVVVTQNSAKYSWAYEVEESLGNIKTAVLGSKDKFAQGYDIYIVNYDSLHVHMDSFKELGIKSLIFDESHLLKNPNSKRTKLAMSLSEGIERIILLTGTPVLNSPVDLISQFNILGKLSYFGGYWEFIKKYCDSKRTTYGIETNGASNLEELAINQKKFGMLRRRKALVLSELPDKIRRHIPLEIPKQLGKKYNNIVKEYRELSGGSKINRLSYIERMRGELALLKSNFAFEWIDNFLDVSSNKLVVFYHHKAVLKKIKDYYIGVNYALLNPEVDIEENVKKFNEDDDCRVIFCSIKAAYVNHNLTVASNVLFIEFDWNPSVNVQAEDRCHRIGQENSVDVTYLTANNTIEDRMIEVILNKEDIIKKLNKPIVDYIMDFFEDE